MMFPTIESYIFYNQKLYYCILLYFTGLIINVRLQYVEFLTYFLIVVQGIL